MIVIVESYLPSDPFTNRDVFLGRIKIQELWMSHLFKPVAHSSEDFHVVITFRVEGKPVVIELLALVLSVQFWLNVEEI